MSQSRQAADGGRDQTGDRFKAEKARAGRKTKPAPGSRLSRLAHLWVPNQPGAWAMALLPPLAGMLIGGLTWRNVLVFVTWLLCYCTEFTASRWLVSHMSGRFLPPAATYAGLTAVSGLALLVSTPGLLRWVPLYALLAALTFWAAWTRSERSLWNNLVSVIAASTLCLIEVSMGAAAQGQAGHAVPSEGRGQTAVLMTSYFGCSPDPAVNCFAEGFFPARALPLIGLVAALMFAYTEFGSVLFVKSMIREHRNPWCYAASVAWNLILSAAAAWVLPQVGFWPLAAALISLARAAITPLVGRKRRIPILHVGMIESFTSLVVFFVTVGTATPIAGLFG